jgi:hypothetical protein
LNEQKGISATNFDGEILEDDPLMWDVSLHRFGLGMVKKTNERSCHTKEKYFSLEFFYPTLGFLPPRFLGKHCGVLQG